MTRAIDVVIEALVLEGFDPADREAIATATVAELTRLIERRDPQREADIRQVSAQPVHLSSLRESRAVGAGIARAIHGALSGSPPAGVS